MSQVIVDNSPLKLNTKYLLLIVMIYFVAILTATAVAFKFVQIGPIVISGATILFPLTYLFSDIITEVYGYNIARKIIWLSLFGELLYSLTIKLVLLLPYAPFANYAHAFDLVDGHLYIFVMGGVIGNILSSFLNIYLISKWKIRLAGRLFWLRSIVSTAISELLIVGVAVIIGFSGQLTVHQQVSVFGWGYASEIFYACIFVWPGWLMSYYLKKAEGLDAYDRNISYNPFRVD